MESTINSKYWYGESLYRAKNNYPNLLLKNLKNKNKTQLQLMYNDYHELSDNLHWDKDKAYEYKRFKELPKYEKELERCRKNLYKIEDAYNSLK